MADDFNKYIDNISMQNLDKNNKWCPNNLGEDSIEYGQTITFNLNDVPPYWKQLGYESEQQYEDSLAILDIETGKKYSFKTGKEIK